MEASVTGGEARENVDRTRQEALDRIKVGNRIRGQTKQGILKSIHDGGSYFLCLNYHYGYASDRCLLFPILKSARRRGGHMIDLKIQSYDLKNIRNRKRMHLLF